MKNLFLLMTAILLVNVSIYAESSMEGMGESDTECAFISDVDGADQVVRIEDESSSEESSSVSN